MSSKPETTFTTSIHRHLPVKLYRMKTHNPYLGGPADVWYSGKSADLWVEYKFEILPKRPNTPITVGCSALQLEWLRDRYNEGRNVAVIAGCKEGGVIMTDLAWEYPIFMSEFKKQLISRADIAAWIIKETGGPP